MSKVLAIIMPTGPIGSIPGPLDLIERFTNGHSDDCNFAAFCEDATPFTIDEFAVSGLAVVTDGKCSAWQLDVAKWLK
jgi:hypothetical protein